MKTFPSKAKHQDRGVTAHSRCARQGMPREHSVVKARQVDNNGYFYNTVIPALARMTVFQL